MLRILVFDEPFSVKLRLEGELTDTTTAQLTQQWGELRGRLRNRKAILDLGDVVKVDEVGRGMLGELADAGVRISYAHPALRPIVEDLSCRQRTLSKFTGNRSSLSIHRVLYRLVCTVLPHRFRPCGCRTGGRPAASSELM